MLIKNFFFSFFLLLQPHLIGTFEETFMEAIQQLTQWGGIVTGEDTE